MKKKLIIVFTIIILTSFLASAWLWHWSRNLITIDNASGKMAASVIIEVCGQNYMVKNLPAGENYSLSFDVKDDSGLQVDVLFADNSKLSGNFGYVTGGLGAYNNKVIIRINSGSIELKQR